MLSLCVYVLCTHHCVATGWYISVKLQNPQKSHFPPFLVIVSWCVAHSLCSVLLTFLWCIDHLLVFLAKIPCALFVDFCCCFMICGAVLHVLCCWPSGTLMLTSFLFFYNQLACVSWFVVHLVHIILSVAYLSGLIFCWVALFTWCMHSIMRSSSCSL